MKNFDFKKKKKNLDERVDIIDFSISQKDEVLRLGKNR